MHHLLTLGVFHERHRIDSERAPVAYVVAVFKGVIRHHKRIAALDKTMVSDAGVGLPRGVGYEHCAAVGGLYLGKLAERRRGNRLTHVVLRTRPIIHGEREVIRAVLVPHERPFVDGVQPLSLVYFLVAVYRRFEQVRKLCKRRIVGREPILHFHAEYGLVVAVAVTRIVQIFLFAYGVYERVRVDCLVARKPLRRLFLHFGIGVFGGEIESGLALSRVKAHERTVRILRIRDRYVLALRALLVPIGVEEHKIKLLVLVVNYLGRPMVGISPGVVEIGLIRDGFVLPISQILAAPALNAETAYKVARAVRVEIPLLLARAHVYNRRVGNFEFELVEVIQIFVVILRVVYGRIRLVPCRRTAACRHRQDGDGGHRRRDYCF